MSDEETRSEAQTSRRIGDYEILGVLGAGGMGKVYRVRNVISDRVEAMKILLPDLAGQKELAERFLREIKLLASLNHPNIASLRTALTVGNQLVMIMEFVEGMTLSARLAQGPIPPADAVDYIEQVLEALGYAHRQHIIHRDIKPANMMLTPQGLVKLMDFGIARSAEDRGLTMTGTTLGSLHYMSPEQIKGEAVDARSDLYSVGVSLYEMVTGRRPFLADSNYSIMAAHLQEAPTPPIERCPGLPPALNQVILMAMAKVPDDRFQSAEAFRNAMKSVSESLGAFPAPLEAVPSPSRTSREGTVRSQQEPIAAGPSKAPTVRAPVQPQDQPTVPARPEPPSGISAQAVPKTVVRPPKSSRTPPPSNSKPGSYRGLYMTFGALLVVGVLVAAGLYGPRWARTRASGGTPPAETPTPTSNPPQPANPSSGATGSSQAPNAGSAGLGASSSATSAGNPAAAQPSSQQTPGEAGSAVGAPPAGSQDRPQTKATPAGAGARLAGSSNSASGGEAPSKPSPPPSPSPPPYGAAATSAPPQTANSAELDDLEQQMDQLSARARAAKDSIENLRREQSAQGLNLRGDISAAEDRMGTDMDKAQAALQNQNASDARKYLGRAEADVEILEKFLGRR